MAALYDCDGNLLAPLNPAIVNNLVPSSGLLIYPNPAKESFTLLINNEVTQGGNLTLQDLSGKVIFHTELQLLEGVNNYPVAIENIPDGMYIVKLYTVTGVKQGKLVINR